MLNQICNQAITPNERTYINIFQPIRGNMYQRYIGRDNNGFIAKIRYLIVLIEKSLESVFDNITISEITFDINQGVRIVSIPSQNYQQLIQLYQDKFSSIDMLSIYNILANRLNCMNIDPNYAKNRTLTQLDTYQRLYNEFITTNNVIDLLYKNEIILTYCMLIMHKYIFNIFDGSKLTKLTDIETNIDEIKHDIDYLFKTIRNRISTL
jgi:hypothetical protein